MADGFPQLYNTETRLPEPVEEQDIEKAVLSGTHAFKSNARVNIISPDGSVGNVAATDVRDFVEQGYKIETPKLRAFNETVEAQSGIAGQAGTLIWNFANSAGFGVPEAIMQNAGDPYDNAVAAAVQKKYPGTAALGKVLGVGGALKSSVGKAIFGASRTAGEGAEFVVANALAKAGVEKGAPSIAKRIVAETATKAAKYGAEGVALATPAAFTEAILGDPDSAAETLLSGGVFGAGFGGLALAGQGLKKSSQVIGEVATNLGGKALKAANLNADSVGGFVKSVERQQTASAGGFTKRYYNERIKGKYRENNLGKERLNKLSDYLQEKKLIKPLESAEDYRDKLVDLADDLQKKVENSFTVLDDNGVKVFSPKMVKGTVEEQLAGRFSNNELTPTAKREVKHVYDFLDNAGQPAPEPKGLYKPSKGKYFNPNPTPGPMDTITFEQALALKQKAVDAMKANPNSQVYKRFVGIMSEALNKASDDGIPMLRIPESEVRLISDLKGEQGLVLDAIKGANEKVAQQGGNKLLGPSSLASGVGGAVLGGGIGSVVGVAANKARMAYGDQVLSVGLNRLQKAMGQRGTQIQALADAVKTGKKFAGSVMDSMPSGTSSIYAMQALLGGKVPKDKFEALDALREKTAAIVSNPDAISELVTQQLGDLPEHMPQVANSFAASYTRALTYLNDQIPKPPNSPSLFASKAKWKPSDREVAAFERKAQIVLDPMSIMKEISDNTLTKEHIMAFQAVYPKLYASIQGKVYESLANGEPNNVPYSRRMKLSLLLGSAIEPSLNANRVETLQKNFIPDKKAEQPRANSKLTIAEQTQTSFNKAEYSE